MIRDQRNKLYFHFLVSVIQEFERINAFFQVKEADPQDLDKELRSHHLSLKRCLFDVNGNSRIDFGVKFLAECTLRMTHRECTLEQIDQVIGMCHDFLKRINAEVEGLDCLRMSTCLEDSKDFIIHLSSHKSPAFHSQSSP